MRESSNTLPVNPRVMKNVSEKSYGESETELSRP